MKVQKLLSTNNAKTIKGEKSREIAYYTSILYMSPFRDNSKNINVCSHASKECAELCLVSSGFGGIYTSVQEGRRKKTEYFLADRVGFLNQLVEEIRKTIIKYEGKGVVTFRLNGTSDLSYEKYKIFDGKNIFEMFPDIQFYDYTKNWTRFDKVLPSNYHLTFSRSEDNHDKAMELLKRGINVAMVFTKTPTEYQGFEVINGDLDDLRWLDKKGVIVGLKYKKNTGKGGAEKNKKALTGGFVINTNEPIEDRLTKTYHEIDKKVKRKAKMDLVESI